MRSAFRTPHAARSLPRAPTSPQDRGPHGRFLLWCASARRRFPSPWFFEDNGACFIVRDSTGQALGYFWIDDDSITFSLLGTFRSSL